MMQSNLNCMIIFTFVMFLNCVIFPFLRRISCTTTSSLKPDSGNVEVTIGNNGGQMYLATSENVFSYVVSCFDDRHLKSNLCCKATKGKKKNCPL